MFSVVASTVVTRRPNSVALVFQTDKARSAHAVLEPIETLSVEVVKKTVVPPSVQPPAPAAAHVGDAPGPPEVST